MRLSILEADVPFPPTVERKELDWFYPAVLAALFLALRNDRYYYSLAYKCVQSCFRRQRANPPPPPPPQLDSVNYRVNDFYFWLEVHT